MLTVISFDKKPTIILTYLSKLTVFLKKLFPSILATPLNVEVVFPLTVSVFMIGRNKKRRKS